MLNLCDEVEMKSSNSKVAFAVFLKHNMAPILLAVLDLNASWNVPKERTLDTACLLARVKATVLSWTCYYDCSCEEMLSLHLWPVYIFFYQLVTYVQSRNKCKRENHSSGKHESNSPNTLTWISQTTVSRQVLAAIHFQNKTVSCLWNSLAMEAVYSYYFLLLLWSFNSLLNIFKPFPGLL